MVILTWGAAEQRRTYNLMVAGCQNGFTGHAIAAGAALVTNNTRESELRPGLTREDQMKQCPKDCRGRFSEQREAGILSGFLASAVWHQMEIRYFHILLAQLHH